MEKLMSGRAVYFLGVISYSVYLVHSVFRPVWLEAIQAMHPAPVSAPVALMIALVGSLSVIPLAWIAYTLVERPGRAAVRSLLAKEHLESATAGNTTAEIGRES
jgi:peptidoglycan/LPS O-acetylase OafA/YrhL